MKLSNIFLDWKLTLLGVLGSALIILGEQLKNGKIDAGAILLSILVALGGALSKIPSNDHK